MKIVTTWSGECFTAKHVQALAKQCETYAPYLLNKFLLRGEVG